MREAKNKLLAVFIVMILIIIMYPMGILAQDEEYQVELTGGEIGHAALGYRSDDFVYNPWVINLSEERTFYLDEEHTNLELTGNDADKFTFGFKDTAGTILPGNYSTKIWIKPIEGLQVGEYNATLTLYYSETENLFDKSLSIPISFFVHEKSSHTVNFIFNGEVFRSQTVELGKRVSNFSEAPQVEEGYAWGGWYVDQEFSKTVDYSVPIYEDTNYYGKVSKYCRVEMSTETYDKSQGYVKCSHYPDSTFGDVIVSLYEGNNLDIEAIPNGDYNFVRWEKWDENKEVLLDTFYNTSFSYNTIEDVRFVAFFEKKHIHKMNWFGKKDATCIEEGHNAYYYCSTCGKYYKDDTALQETTIEAETLPIDVTAHDLSLNSAIEPSCVNNGHKEFYICCNCGKIFEDSNGTTEIIDESSLIIEKTGHDWNEWVVDTPATVDTVGYKIRTCKNNCEYIESEEIPFLDLEITEGANTVYYTNINDNDVEVRCNAALRNLKEVQMDGTKINGYRSTSNGGTTVILEAYYLHSLSAGTHTLTFVYENNRAINTSLTIEKERALADGLYEIHLYYSDKVWEIDKTGKSEVWKGESSSIQKYEICYDENSESYYIINEFHNKKVGIENDEIKLYSIDDTDVKTQWIISGNNSEGYTIKAKSNGLVLDIQAADYSDGNKIRVYRYNGTNAQKFYLQETTIDKASKTLETGEYQILTALDENYVIEIQGSGKDNFVTSQIGKNHKILSQIFKITYMDNGYYKIENKYSKKALDIKGVNIRRGAYVHQYEYCDGLNQQWIIKDCGDGTYNIISRFNGLYMDVQGASASNGTPIWMYSPNGTNAQKFYINKIEECEPSHTIEDGEYEIFSCIDANYEVSIYGGSANGANCQLNFANHQKNQKFRIKDIGDGYYEIKNSNSGKNLDVSCGAIDIYTNIWQYAPNTTDAQKWIIKSNDDGTYSIISKLNGLYLDVLAGVAQENQNIHLFYGNGTNAQKFYIDAVEPMSHERTIEDGYYKIQSCVNTNYVLDISGGKLDNGANLQLWSNDSVQQQKVYIKYADDGYYNIKFVHSGKAMDVQAASTLNGTNIWQYAPNTTDAQKWIIKDEGNGNYSIISKLSELYLDVLAGEAKNGSNVQVYSGNNTLAQRWKIVRAKGVDESSYKITSYLNRSKALDVDNASLDSNVSVHLLENQNKRQQIYAIKYVDENYFKIEASYSGKVLTIDGNDNVVQNSFTGSNLQLWSLELGNSGAFYIKLKDNSKYLTIDSANENARVYVSSKNNVDLQQFYFESITKAKTGTYGKSGLYYLNGGGYDLPYYQYGYGENVLFATFEVHGFEDNWYADGDELRIIANNFYDKLRTDKDIYIAQNWTVYIFPTVNPDGLYNGYTNNGPGRTTLYSKASSHQGIDINRNWQVGSTYQIYTDSRNYNGTSGFQAYEADALRNFMLNHKSTTGRNILIDLHGWEGSLIGSTEILANYFKPQFTDSVEKYERYGSQYVISWGRSVLGADTALVELPYYIRNHQDALYYDISGKYINATTNMLKNIVLYNKVNFSNVGKVSDLILEENQENNYYVACLGALSQEVNNSNISLLKEKLNERKGLYLSNSSEKDLLNIINSICNYEYRIDEDGKVYKIIDSTKESNKYDIFIERLIASEKYYLLNNSGSIYIIDLPTNEVVENEYEYLDERQAYDYACFNGNYVIDIPKNKNAKLTNEEIFDSIIKMIEIESMR